MKIAEIVLESVRNLVMSIVLIGLLSLTAGVLIIIYPDLLGILVGALLVVSGAVWLYLAAKLNKYSKVKIDL